LGKLSRWLTTRTIVIALIVTAHVVAILSFVPTVRVTYETTITEVLLDIGEAKPPSAEKAPAPAPQPAVTPKSGAPAPRPSPAP
jgi:hypothetical protein